MGNLSQQFFPNLSQGRYDRNQWGFIVPGATHLSFFSPEQKKRISEAITETAEEFLETSRVKTQERQNVLRLKTQERAADTETATQKGLFANLANDKNNVIIGIAVVIGLVIFFTRS